MTASNLMNMEYEEEDFLPLSGIQHYVFCKRQWALIHIEQEWEENVRTVEGSILHERAHDLSLKEKRGDVITSRAMPVFSKTLGIRGICDVVELRKNPQGVTIFGHEGKFLPYPVEYKRGKPKDSTDADVLQLTAQAMCLEEMLLCKITEGALFYGEINRRQKIVLEQSFRDRVTDMCWEMHQLFERRHTPKVKTGKSCKACSLAEICLPKLCGRISATEYIERNLSE